MQIAVASRGDCTSNAPSPSNAARLGDEVGIGGAFRRDLKGALLHDIGAIGGVAGGEQHLPRFDRIGFGADGEDAQGRGAEPAKHRHLAQKRDVILDGHDNPRSGRKIMLPIMVPSDRTNHGTNL